MLRLSASLLVLFSTASAAPSKGPVDHYTVRVKVQNGAGFDYVPVGEVTRTGGTVVAKGLPAPAVDKLTDEFLAAWKAYKPPASVTITESIADHTGMRPAHRDHTFTFTAKDRLYMPAVLREFAAKRHYEVLGMSSIQFIVFDSSKEWPPGAHDRASTRSNFRKGDKIYFRPYESFFIKVPVRPAGMGKPDMVLRTSQRDPHLAVAQNWDDGTVTVAWMKLYPDNHFDIEPLYAGRQFEGAFGVFKPEPIDVSVIIDAKDWQKRTVPKTSPLLLEAHIVENLERRNFYDVTPVIDPADLR